MIEEFDYLVWIFKNEKTHFSEDPKKRDTSIDLTIITQDLFNRIDKNMIERHIGSSKHSIIKACMKEKTKKQQTAQLNKKKVLKNMQILKLDRILALNEIKKR